MNEKQNNVTKSNGFSKRIGRTNFVVHFTFKKNTTENIRDKTKKLIYEEAIRKKC